MIMVYKEILKNDIEKVELKSFDKSDDVSLLSSGHDEWEVGNETLFVVDFQGMIDYAKAKS